MSNAWRSPLWAATTRAASFTGGSLREIFSCSAWSISSMTLADITILLLFMPSGIQAMVGTRFGRRLLAGHNYSCFSSRVHVHSHPPSSERKFFLGRTVPTRIAARSRRHRSFATTSSVSLFMTYSFPHNWRFGLFSLAVLNDVPGVTTARDEFSAFSG